MGFSSTILAGMLIFSFLQTAFADDIKANCKIGEGKFYICSPSIDWVFLEDFSKSEERRGMVWFHKKRKGSQINSFVVAQDRSTNIKDFEAYTHYAKFLMEERRFKVKKTETPRENLTIFTLTSADEKNTFYQAYARENGITWTMSCMGPDESIMQKDCTEFFKSAKTF